MPKHPLRPVVTFRLTRHMIGQLDEIADRAGTSRTEVCTMAVERLIAEHIAERDLTDQMVQAGADTVGAVASRLYAVQGLLGSMSMQVETLIRDADRMVGEAAFKAQTDWTAGKTPERERARRAAMLSKLEADPRNPEVRRMLTEQATEQRAAYRRTGDPYHAGRAAEAEAAVEQLDRRANADADG